MGRTESNKVELKHHVVLSQIERKELKLREAAELKGVR